MHPSPCLCEEAALLGLRCIAGKCAEALEHRAKKGDATFARNDAAFQNCTASALRPNSAGFSRGYKSSFASTRSSKDRTRALPIGAMVLLGSPGPCSSRKSAWRTLLAIQEFRSPPTMPSLTMQSLLGQIHIPRRDNRANSGCSARTVQAPRSTKCNCSSNDLRTVADVPICLEQDG